MSRSYRKTPIIKDNGRSKKSMKRIANSRVRTLVKNGEDIGNGGYYKKYFESWEIADFVNRWSKEDAIKHYEEMTRDGGKKCLWYDDFIKEYPTLESYLNLWEKYMRRK
ncbi:MAG: hypothetical protein J6W64_06420 [Bacilli bacterium]|nr:hypothetical protein [Bacilli bacterium]